MRFCCLQKVRHLLIVIRVLLGYELALPLGISITPNFGLLVDENLIDPYLLRRLFLGVLGEYDLRSFGRAQTYALGGLSFLDFSDEISTTPRSELQYALGFGAALPLSQNIGAFTNLSHTPIDGTENQDSYEITTTGLEIGIEITF